eukprot:5715766-Prymnesium_polylepis.1
MAGTAPPAAKTTGLSATPGAPPGAKRASSGSSALARARSRAAWTRRRRMATAARARPSPFSTAACAASSRARATRPASAWCEEIMPVRRGQRVCAWLRVRRGHRGRESGPTTVVRVGKTGLSAGPFSVLFTAVQSGV